MALSPVHGTFVNVWLLLNGLLLDYRVWGPNPDIGAPLVDSPLRLSRDRMVAAGEEGGSVCLCRVVKMFEKLIHFVEYLWFLKNKACGWWHQDESRYGRKKKKQTSGQKVDGKTIAFFKLFSIFFPSFCNCDFFFLSHRFYFSSEFQGYLMGCWESHNQTAINFQWLL